MPSFKEQLMWLKANTIRTGVVHEAQALQLKMYPLIIPHAINGTGKAIVDTDRKFVEFSVECEQLRPTKKFAKICKAIETWTRTILWDDTTVVIKANDKTVFDSRNS